MKKKQILLALLLFQLCFVLGRAQQTSGRIQGRVIAEDGSPIAHASISLIGVGGGKNALASRNGILTDREGNFTVEGLDAIPYEIYATTMGYVSAPDSIGQTQFDLPGRNYVHVGESVTIRMIRGGVITGRVTNASGEPVIGIGVYTTRVQDEAGQSAPRTANRIQGGAMTDDRGIYRIYGLRSGKYVVWAGMSYGGSTRPIPYVGRSPIYHPSSTMETAARIAVTTGQETIGIDIRYRSENGYAVSGKVAGSTHRAEAYMSGPNVLLRNSKSRDVIATTYASPGDEFGFTFYGIQKGEYELLAVEGVESGTGQVSSAHRVSVLDKDVNGIDLRLTGMASIQGTLSLDKTLTCDATRFSSLNEIVLSPRHNEPGEKNELQWPDLGFSHVGVPDEKGVFTMGNLNPGRHLIEAELPDETWYLKSITPAAPIVLKAGEKRSGLSVTIATGAASLNGKAKSGTRLKLSPAEKEFKDDPLRQYETVAADDRFVFRNLAPGKYQLTADEKSQAVELKSCQKLNDLVVN